MNESELYAKAGTESLIKLNEICSKYKLLDENKDLTAEIALAFVKSFVEGYHLANAKGDELNVDYTKEFDRPYVLEGSTKWFVDKNGNHTGEGITKDGCYVNDLVYRQPLENEYDKYTNNIKLC